MKRPKPLKFRWRTMHISFWLMVLSCGLVLIAHPAIAVKPETVIPAIAADSPSPRNAAVQMDTGRQHYSAGQFNEAVQSWQQARQSYQTQGDRLNQALSLSYLSLAYQGLGNWPQAEQSIQASLDLLQASKGDRATTAILALALNTQGQLQLAQGQTEAALATWEMAEKAYSQVPDVAGTLGSQINQAQALQNLGLYRRAQSLLERSRQQLKDQPPSAVKISGLQNLGNVLQIVGDLTNAKAVLQESLEIAQQLNLPADVSTSLFSLGNTLRAAQDIPAALQFYQQAATTAPTPIARLEAQVNQLSLLIDTQKAADAEALQQQIATQLPTLPPSRTGIYVQVNWATSVLRGHQRGMDQNQPSLRAIADQLTTAVQQARQLQDARAESFALGHLGSLYEQTGQWAEAEKLTQQALREAQDINAADIAYRWQWQLGRIFNQEENRGAAITAYNESVNLLKSLRRDLIAMSPDVQFSFRESVEPVYRELVTLLVQPETPTQQELQHAREVIEGLQQAELENFLRSACLDIRLSDVDKADPAAAIIYPIILPDRLTVITALPGQPLRVHNTSVPKAKIEATVEKTLESLNPLFSDEERLQLSRQLYDWLIRPMAADLAKSPVKTLVFVLDGALRNLPMAALYDGKRYLIESYGVAITPGLQLLGPQESLAKGKFQALIGALTEARQGFAALPGVAVESEKIAAKVVSNVLLNKSFTQKELQEKIQTSASPIVHLATHGQFSSDLEKTFILTWDNRLTIEGVKNSLKSRAETNQNPIELLVLSACETAEGDKRAALGLAGLAVRSGARSTLASLWAVNDASTTELMVRFYQSLTQKGLNKAESLRQGQLELLKTDQYSHPFYWAPFILVGNWL
jgi:CHAT domain-containing protein/tetratricopeptide (TPR) repeat protein